MRLLVVAFVERAIAHRGGRFPGGALWPREARFQFPAARELVTLAAQVFERRPVVKTAKDDVRQILDELPDNASLEEIQYRIYVRQKIERELRDLDEGRSISQEEAEARMSKWLDD